MQISKGENFGNRLPQLRQSNIPSMGGNAGASIASSLSALGDAFQKISDDKAALNKLDIDNQFTEAQQVLNESNNELEERINSGELSDDDLIKSHNQNFQNIKKPNISHLNEYDQKVFNNRWSSLEYSQKMLGVAFLKKSWGVKGTNQLTQIFGTSLQESMKPDADLEAIKQQFESEEINKVGLLVHAEKWPQQKEDYLNKVNLNYIQGRINIASANNDTKSLQELREKVLDAEQFKGVDAFQRHQFIEKIDGRITVQKGTNYARSVTHGIEQAFAQSTESAVMYACLISQASVGESAYAMQLEQAQSFAAANNIDFDAKRFTEDKSYRIEVGQAYYDKALKNFGTPLLASMAYIVGDEQANKWLKEFGDPRSKQISEQDFIDKLPNKAVKEQLTKAFCQKKIPIKELVKETTSGPNLSKEEKNFAAREVELSCKVLEEQHTTAYLANQNAIWCDIHVNKKSLDEIAPESLDKLYRFDRQRLNGKPPEELDPDLFREVRSRVKSGDTASVIKDYGNKLPVENIMELVLLEQELQKNPEQRQVLKDNYKLVDDLYNKETWFYNYKESRKLHDIVSEEILWRKKQNKPMSPSEIEAFIKKQLITVKLEKTGTLINDSKYLYQTNKEDLKKAYVKDISAVPVHIKDQLVVELRARGLPETDEQILLLFNEELRNGKY